MVINTQASVIHLGMITKPIVDEFGRTLNDFSHKWKKKLLYGEGGKSMMI